MSERTAPTTGAREIPGRSPDGRQWDLVAEPGGVVAVMGPRTVAEARLSAADQGIVVEFWADDADLPPDLAAALVAQAFAHPAVTADRPVVACVPRRAGELLDLARRHVRGARVRAAGVTCLVEGRTGDAGTTPYRSEPPGSGG
jgi:hypothetical protein